MLYFMHVPKTAGTSLRMLVHNRLFPGRVREVYDDFGYWNRPALRDRVGDGDVLYGHFCHGFHALLGDRDPRYVTVLRDPVERVVSLYWHQRNVPGAPFHGLINGQNLGIADFVEARLTEESDNHQVRMLAAHYGRVRRWREIAGNRLYRALTGNPTRPLWTRALLRRAKANIRRNFLHVGRTEDMGATLDVLAELAGVGRETLVLGRENVLRPDGYRLSPGDRRVIENANELDLELYEGLFGAARAYGGLSSPNSSRKLPASAPSGSSRSRHSGRMGAASALSTKTR